MPFILPFFFALIFLFGFNDAGYDTSVYETETIYTYDDEYNWDEDYEIEYDGYDYEEYKDFEITYVFDDMEYTFHSNVTITKAQDIYSENSADIADLQIIAVPLTVTNIGDEHNQFRSFFCTVNDPDYAQLEMMNYYFEDDICRVGSIAPGETIETVFHVQYTTDGDYELMLDNFEGDCLFLTLPIYMDNITVIEDASEIPESSSERAESSSESSAEERWDEGY